MASFARVHHGEPMANINVTPFIDVVLVLLIMIIMTVPMATHKVAIDLPQGPSTVVDDQPHKLLIDKNGALQWDGRAVKDGELRGLLDALQANPKASLQLQTDPGTRYERFDHILAVVKRAGVTRLGFVGNEQMKF
jgi:biopolymer transport protein ExbD